MKPNSNVKHPSTLLRLCRNEQNKLVQYNDKFLEFIANNILGSILFFDIALIIPIVAIFGPTWFSAIVLIISSEWIQLWALFALQHTQKKADTLREAKNNVDHETMTYVVNQLDRLVGEKNE